MSEINTFLAENIETMRKLHESLREAVDPEEKVRIRDLWDYLARHSLGFARTGEELEELRNITRGRNEDVLAEIDRRKARVVTIN